MSLFFTVPTLISVKLQRKDEDILATMELEIPYDREGVIQDYFLKTYEFDYIVHDYENVKFKKHDFGNIPLLVEFQVLSIWDSSHSMVKRFPHGYGELNHIDDPPTIHMQAVEIDKASLVPIKVGSKYYPYLRIAFTCACGQELLLWIRSNLGKCVAMNIFPNEGIMAQTNLGSFDDAFEKICKGAARTFNKNNVDAKVVQMNGEPFKGEEEDAGKDHDINSSSE